MPVFVYTAAGAALGVFLRSKRSKTRSISGSGIYSSPYKKVTFSIFNFIENDGFIDELFCADKTRYGIDDFDGVF